MDHAQKYIAAVEARAQARTAHHAFEKHRTQNPIGFMREWQPEHDATKVALIEAEAEVHEAASKLNANDGALVALKSWFAGALDAVAERFAEVDAASGTQPELSAVSVEALEDFCTRTAALTDPEYARKAKIEIRRSVDAVFATLARARKTLDAQREAAGLPDVPQLYNPKDAFPGLMSGVPAIIACTSGAACRALADAVRSYESPQPAERKRNELKLIEQRHEAYRDEQERAAVAAADRVRDHGRRSPAFR